MYATFQPQYIRDGRKGADIDHPTAVGTRTCCCTCMVVEIGTTMRIHQARSADSEAESLASEPRISEGISWISYH